MMSIGVLLRTHLLRKGSSGKREKRKITWFDFLLLWLKANYENFFAVFFISFHELICVSNDKGERSLV